MRNGLCSVPQKFTSLFKHPLVSFIKLRVTVAAYIDDLIIVAKTFCQCSSNIKDCVGLLSTIGFVIRPIFTPTQSIEYLGFVLNSKAMTISVIEKF